MKKIRATIYLKSGKKLPILFKRQKIDVLTVAYRNEIEHQAAIVHQEENSKLVQIIPHDSVSYIELEEVQE